MLLKVQPDTEYGIVEERLRFEVPAGIPEKAIPFYIARDLAKSIELLERLRGYRVIDRIPTRLKFCAAPCCPSIALGMPGRELPIKFEKSAFQGDTDDAHNFDEMSDPDKRALEENIEDWVAIVHFWEPLVVRNIADAKAAMESEEGLVRPEDMPDRTPLSVKIKQLAAEGADVEMWQPLAAEEKTEW